jgi:hypothetical protein
VQFWTVLVLEAVAVLGCSSARGWILLVFWAVLVLAAGFSLHVCQLSSVMFHVVDMILQL